MLRATCSLALLLVLAACPKEAKVDPSAPPAQPEEPTSQPTKTGDASAAMPHEDPAHQAEHAKASGDREAVDADGVVRRGKALTAGGDVVTVSMAAEKAAELSGKNIKLSGKVESVCQTMGCWFVLQGDKPEHSIRISTKGHDIFVPKSAAGMMATVEGEFTVKTLDAKTAQHFEDERELKEGEQRKTFTTETKELSIAVVGLEMKRPPAG
jgi:Domain of unknown function (DUF4920)